ncbi:MAG TPA: WYL domain-containing protein [Candidatus Acidoferrum sp.]|nr:WYL domain-containing protein [Candidatus Acidoferrum sp.]
MAGRKKMVPKSTKTRKRASAARDARVRTGAADGAGSTGQAGGPGASERGRDRRGPDREDGEGGSERGRGSSRGGSGHGRGDGASGRRRGQSTGGRGSARAGKVARSGRGERGATRGGRARKRAARAAIGSSPSPRLDRAKRLLDLVMLLLRARTPVTFRDIREQFESYQTSNIEAGLRAFERDKADLLELGVPIRYITPDEDDSLEEGGYVVDLKRFRLPEVHLTAEEVSALVLAASVAHAVPGDDYARIVDLALRKLAFDVPEVPDTPLEWPPPPSAVTRREPVLVHFPSSQGPQTRELGDRFAELESATRNRKRATFRYRPASTGYSRTREVDPYGLFYREGSWLLVGHCHLRKDVRSFRLDRMSDLVIAPKPKTPDFERPADFDVRAYANRSPWTFRAGPVEEVELEIGPEAAAVANEDFGPDAARGEGPDGSVRMRFSCGNADFALSRIMAAKGAIRVVSGPRLLQRLRDELDAVTEHYQR